MDMQHTPALLQGGERTGIALGCRRQQAEIDTIKFGFEVVIPIVTLKNRAAIGESIPVQ